MSRSLKTSDSRRERLANEARHLAMIAIDLAEGLEKDDPLSVTLHAMRMTDAGPKLTGEVVEILKDMVGYSD